MEAMFCSEERYASLTVYFSTKEEKQSVCDLMKKLLEGSGLEPDVTIVPVSEEKKGELVIEFHDDYDRKAQPLVDTLASTLNLTFIPCDI